MIYYVCRAAHTYTMERLIGYAGLAASGLVSIVPYEVLFRTKEISAACCIFTDFDRLNGAQIERVARIVQRIVANAPETRILNHPLRVQERYALLRSLALRGLNPFDVARLDERRKLRFPVFIRREDGAEGPETDLLSSEREYEAALAAFASTGRTPSGRIAVEYADTRSPDGWFRKYGALRIGQRIIPLHMFAAKEWLVKREHLVVDDAIAAEELEYVRGNPHGDQLMQIFEIGGIEYGRIDYGVVEGRVVTFEINTNPTLGGPDRADSRQLRRAHARDATIAALQALDAPAHRKPPL